MGIVRVANDDRDTLDRRRCFGGRGSRAPPGLCQRGDALADNLLPLLVGTR